MQAVILAGGLGMRLRPLTEKVPKPLVPIRGKPFLQYQLEMLARFGVTDMLLLVSYLGEQIEDFFGDGSQHGMHLSYSFEETSLGTGGALKNAESKLQVQFLLLNGDTFLRVDYRQVVRVYLKRRRWGLVVAFENHEETISNNLAVGRDGRVTAYIRPPVPGLTHVHAGVAVFNRRVLELIPPGRVCSFEEEIYRRLIEQGQFTALSTGQPFYDIGSPSGLEATAQALL